MTVSYTHLDVYKRQRRRCAVEHAREEYEVSERRACRVVKQWRGTQRYLPLRRTDEDQLTQAILALAVKLSLIHI